MVFYEERHAWDGDELAYMGACSNEFWDLADAVVVVSSDGNERRLPVHSLVLAKQCQEFCNAYLVEKQQNIK